MKCYLFGPAEWCCDVQLVVVFPTSSLHYRPVFRIKRKGVKMKETFFEFVNNGGTSLCVDRENGIIRGVKVLGLESRNNRTYLKEAVARAVGLYEGAKVNVNHPAGSPNQPRCYEDRLGMLRNVRLEQGNGGLRGDFHFNPKHALAEQLIWDAEHSPENVGFSHNVEARCTRKDGKTVVEEITRVVSVDLVADPATTRGLFEHVEPIEKKALVEAVADSIGLPRWAITPLDLGLSYCHTREEIKVYLEDIQGILFRRGVVPPGRKQIAESVTDGKSFVRLVKTGAVETKEGRQLAREVLGLRDPVAGKELADQLKHGCSCSSAKVKDFVRKVR